MLGPFALKDSQKRIMENIWQFSKIYQYTGFVEIKHSTDSNTVVWNYQKTQFIDFNTKRLTNEYFQDSGQNNTLPVPNPVGCSHLKECCQAAIKDCDLYLFKGRVTNNIDDKDGLTIEEGKKYLLDYIESRKQIYLPIYSELVRESRI